MINAKVSVRLIKDEAGSPIYFLPLTENITEKIKISDSMKKNGDLLRTASYFSKFGGWSVDLDKKIITWSDEVADIHKKTTRIFSFNI